MGNENWLMFTIMLAINWFWYNDYINTKQRTITMIKVEQTAKTLDEGIKNFNGRYKKDYERWSTQNGQKELSGYSKEQVDEWDNKTKISQGKKYIKIVQDTGVFCFIVKEDFKHFKKGDVLKVLLVTMRLL